ncbi:MAG: acyl-CoA desaturase [Candidatus Wallbacteria bacterium]|nr:acyl-CoA desaturase [Candidatus Wallbacteria bacterium]
MNNRHEHVIVTSLFGAQDPVASGWHSPGSMQADLENPSDRGGVGARGEASDARGASAFDAELDALAVPARVTGAQGRLTRLLPFQRASGRTLVFFLALAHLLAAWTIVTRSSVFAWVCVLTASALCGCLGITFCFHRLLAHRSFVAPLWLERTTAVIGCLAFQGDPIEWVAIHRRHHRYSDGNKDPHDATRGLLHSHLGWIATSYFEWVTPGNLLRHAPDLLRDPFYVKLKRAYWQLGAGWAILCWLVGGLDGLLWGVFVRAVLTNHSTWLVNSAAHTLGYQAFANPDRSTNCLWTAVLTFGEGWHNNHHAYPFSARHGLEWWQLDITWLLIRILERLRLVTKVQMPSAAAIAAARPPPDFASALGIRRLR